MREIKFRAYDIERKKLIYQEDTNGTNEYKDYHFKLSRTNVLLSRLHEKYNIYVGCSAHIMQYTGLKDKNGIKIYDGDIVELAISDFESELFEAGLLENTKEIFEKIIGVVKFYNGIFYVDYITDDEEDLSIPLVNELKFINVIGNIYENPELLGE